MLGSDGGLSLGEGASCFDVSILSVAPGDDMPDQKIAPRYRADITAGSLKVTESRRIADLLINKVDGAGWSDAIVKRNILQAKSPATARRLSQLIRLRLETLGPDIWKLIRDGQGPVAIHATFAAAVKQSPLLGDFLALVVADQYRRFGKTLSNKMFSDYLDGCRERDPLMPAWTEETRLRVRSSVFQMLAQAGYIENTRSLKLQSVHVADPVVRCLIRTRDRRSRTGLLEPSGAVDRGRAGVSDDRQVAASVHPRRSGGSRAWACCPPAAGLRRPAIRRSR